MNHVRTTFINYSSTTPDKHISYDNIDRFLGETVFPVFMEMRGFKGVISHYVCIFCGQIIDGNYHTSLHFNLENISCCLGGDDSFKICLVLFQIVPKKDIRQAYEMAE